MWYFDGLASFCHVNSSLTIWDFAKMKLLWDGPYFPISKISLNSICIEVGLAPYCHCTAELTSSAGNHPLLIWRAGKPRPSAQPITHATFRRRSPLAQTGATRPHTTGYQWRPFPQTQTPWDELWAQALQSQTQHEQTPNFTQPPLYPIGCPDQRL